MAATVDEDVARSTIGACPTETLGSVALLQRALILLHCQTVIGQAQFLMSRLWVQFKGLTVGLEARWLTVAAPCLVDGLDKEDVARAALQTVHRVVVLLDVGDDHPAVCRVV